MSRCFPFPPPSYANKGEALDELIKLRKDKEEAKLKRKEHKLQKKLRKERTRNTETEKSVADGKVKKNEEEKYPQEKKRGIDLYDGNLSKAVVEKYPQQKKRKNDLNGGNLSKVVVEEKYPQQKKRKTELEGRYLSKAVVDESDQLESSDLTQEHEQPTCSGSVSFVSDSTQSHPKKRRLQESLSNDGDSERKIIRIRLRNTASEVHVLKSSGSGHIPSVLTKSEFGKHSLKPCQELPLATPEGRNETKRPGLIFKQSQELPLAPQENRESKKHETQNLHLKPARELPLSGTQESNESKSNEAQKFDVLEPDLELSLDARQESKKSRKASKTSLFIDGIQSSDQFYGKLLEPWVLPRLEEEHYDSDEDDWLNGSEQENKQESTIHKPANVLSCSRSSHLWPQANYLPEADIFGLPYTVPF
ncbi:uncharacterized protein LOC133804306 [Humulus lupulus]|uniref:uncharacterized protein LOC133804306 n=1 Tax=Humulus lupulus TaxID=3486 RepID=UPI002B40E7EB|nr:uncharacterized protein LOC133804306 [Humulus lupulus]